MNILILGSGGREHAFAYNFLQSTRCEKLFVAPGNAGTKEIAINLDLKLNDFEGIKKSVLENDIQMIVVGPEAPLVEGIADYFAQDS